MTLYRNTALGVSPSGRAWSFRIYHSSAASLATVEADWLAQITSFWTNGSHGVETLFPVATVLGTTKTESVAVVTVGGVDKLRSTGVIVDNPALAGTSVNASQNDQDAVLVSLRTNLPGKENRGRIHLPAPDQTLVTDSELGSVSATRVTTAVTALLSGMAAAGHQPVLVTAKRTLIGTAVGTTKNILTPAETDRIVRTMRQRAKTRKAVYV